MKTLQTFADNNGLLLVPVKYRFRSSVSKGYDLCTPDGYIVAAFEPFNKGWKINSVHEGYKGKRYFPRITKDILKDLNPTAKSYYINSSIK